MTNEEAKALFEEDLKDGKCTNDCPECNAREKAISALEKQMPKEVVIQKIDEDIEFLYCPRCHVRFIRMGMKYCGECGQALDWDYHKYMLNKEYDHND